MQRLRGNIKLKVGCGCGFSHGRGQVGRQGEGERTTIRISRRLISISLGNRADAHAAIACYYSAENSSVCADSHMGGGRSVASMGRVPKCTI